MHAIALREIYRRLSNTRKEIKCLDIGSGSGYMLVALRKLFEGNEIYVFGVEHIKQLIEKSVENISRNNKIYLDDKSIILIEADGRVGLKENAPFDCIHVGAATNLKVVDILIDQLKVGGVLFVPVEKDSYSQFINVYVKKANGEIEKNELMEVRYIPLTSKSQQLYRDL